eukprot:5686081-Pyramimonas_sp.AAC.1
MKLRCETWGGVETARLIDRILDGPGALRRSPDWLGWKPTARGDLLSVSAAALHERFVAAGRWATNLEK